MDMDHSPRVLDKLLEQCVEVSVERIIMIVLDEASFLGTPHLHHLDQRLQQLLGCKLPFGGLVVVLAGGACLPLRALPLAHSPSPPCLLTFTGVYAQTSTSCSR